MSTAKVGDLEIQIEELVREHIAAVRQAASAAVARAFERAAGRSAKGKRAAPKAKEPGGRRSSEEVAALGERLYAAICAHPGAAMITLATHMSVPSAKLNLPATQLRQAGRVRTAGQRGGTRYFPMSAKTTARS